MSRERFLFLTGRLARPRLDRVLAGLREPAFDWAVQDMGVKVAALMTEAIIERRLQRPVEADRVIVPGRCRGDLERLSGLFGVPFVRGPDELADLPSFLGFGAAPPDLSRYDIRIFAEIVEAPQLSVADILARARQLRAGGADVIDLGGLPDTPFPHLEEAVRALAADGMTVSVDSADPGELERGARAGAKYVLSLTEETLGLAADTGAIPVLVPAQAGDLDSLLRAVDRAEALGLEFLADPILDPIHFGFTQSLLRYAELRRLRPGVEILMGTGNLTELTDADSVGVTAVLLGVCSELGIRNVLSVQVSPHTRRTLAEHDAARRLMFAAREDHSLPRGYGRALLCLHDRKPFPATPEDIAAMAEAVRDANFRIETAEDGIHVYNRDGHHVGTSALAMFPKLNVEADGAHAFYLGTELMKAETALRLGKRYSQDEPLDWGAGAEREAEDLTRLAEAGHTLRAKEGR
ncbi:DUF6513 domain-containing protein [Faunimonas sp. B44]|uniref:DUF6513 domain-containing protein n=1 Tax=Faunimonas sp. B44 TaxID=3461493 RepID=UPI004044642D